MTESIPAMQATPDPRRWKALALLCASFFMVILDSAIVIVALPSIESDLGFAAADLQWILSAYALTFGGLLLLGGRAADLIGRRRVFMVGLGFFTLASLLCALAWSPGALIAARAIQGVGAAIMTPTALSIVMTTFEEGAERNKALGIWGSLGGIGGTAGWLIGGPLTDIAWEWIFLINLPVGAISLFLTPRLLPDSRAAEGRRGYDPLGAVSVTAALVLAVYAVVEAPDVGWGIRRRSRSSPARLRYSPPSSPSSPGSPHRSCRSASSARRPSWVPTWGCSCSRPSPSRCRSCSRSTSSRSSATRRWSSG
jgi:MFS family permease